MTNPKIGYDGPIDFRFCGQSTILAQKRNYTVNQIIFSTVIPEEYTFIARDTVTVQFKLYSGNTVNKTDTFNITRDSRYTIVLGQERTNSTAFGKSYTTPANAKIEIVCTAL